MRPIKFRQFIGGKIVYWGFIEGAFFGPSANGATDENAQNTPQMQFTGLLDKNGKECWEGDLMLTDDMYHDYEDGVAINALPDGKIVEVVFRDGGFFAGDELLCEYATAWEIIGNIHENPELINA